MSTDLSDGDKAILAELLRKTITASRFRHSRRMPAPLFRCPEWSGIEQAVEMRFQLALPPGEMALVPIQYSFAGNGDRGAVL